MADQGKWFKLWESSLDDFDLENLSIYEWYCWARFGVYMKKHGKGGKMRLRSPATALLNLFRIDTFEEAIKMIKRFPNYHIEEGQNVTANVTVESVTYNVVCQNWSKYQGDFSGDRVKRYRHRVTANVTVQEEKRRDVEEKRQEESITPNAFALRREELKTQDLDSFIRRWKQVPKSEKDSAMAEIMTGIKAFRLGFKMEDEIYKKIMGDPNASNGGTSGISYSAIARAKREAEETRNKASRGTVLSGLRDMPDVQLATDSD